MAEDSPMSKEDMIQAQMEVYHHSLSYIKSMALGAATELRVPDAIDRCGGAIALSDLAAKTGIHPSKLSHFRRLMRALAVTGVFSIQDQDRDGGAVPMYKLTRVSRLLVGAGRGQLSPMVRMLVDPVTVTTPFSICEWFADERPAESLFEVAHGGCTQKGLWEKDGEYGGPFYSAMVADSCIIMEIVLSMRESASIFEAVSSLVDAGGGHGVVAATIARAFPHIKCTVLDLPCVVAAAPTDSNIQFVAGDMFEYIPPADVVLLKWILHDWQDEDCVKILRKCKEAIPARDAGGKVIIIDMVVGYGSQEIASKETQVLFDLLMMIQNGVEREEHEWRKIFTEAGFTDYKIIPVLGARSIIEVFP